MLSIFKKTISSSSSPANISSRSETPISSSDEELSTWQIVNASLSGDDDEEDLYSLHSEESESESESKSVIEKEIEIEIEEEVTCDSRDSVPIDDVMLLRSLSVSPPTIFPVEVTRHRVGEAEVTCDSRDSAPIDDVMLLRSLSVSPPTNFPVEMARHRVGADDLDEEEVVEDDDVDDDVYGYDVDDELVPWKLKDRYGKQRIKKLGKRGGGGGGGSKFNKSKKSLPYYYYNRPGKLALSVQHTYM